jgi:hypothetical protein
MSIQNLSYDQKICVLKDFPSIKLSYETIAHKKVNEYDFIYAIPQGKKCFAWFSIYQGNPVCFIMDIDTKPNSISMKQPYTKAKEDYNISNISIYPCCFDKTLAYVTGTIFYGTQFYRYPDKEQTYFTIQDVFYYKSKDVTSISMYDKLSLITDVFSKQEELKQVAYTKQFIVIGLPVTTSSWKDMEEVLVNKSITYRVSFFQFRKYNSYTKDAVLGVRFIDKDTNVNTKVTIPINATNSINNTTTTTTVHNSSYLHINKKQTKLENEKNDRTNYVPKQPLKQTRVSAAIFLVKPDIETDIYHLYCKHKDLDEYYFNIACVPDYKTSVLMNKLFRNIKENDNLDSLEESDDEEEFENDKTDKYVYLDRKFYMYCVFNMKFKKWTPVRLAATYEIKNLCNYIDVSLSL